MAHATPATRPNTTQSISEILPNRLSRCTTAATSPASSVLELVFKQNLKYNDGSLACNVVRLCCENSCRNDVVIKNFQECVFPKPSSQDEPAGYVSRILGSFSRKPENELRSISPFSRQTLPYPVQEQHQTRRISRLHVPCNACNAKQFHQKPPCSERDGMEVCSSTSLLSRSLAFPTHWQNGFRV